MRSIFNAHKIAAGQCSIHMHCDRVLSIEEQKFIIWQTLKTLGAVSGMKTFGDLKPEEVAKRLGQLPFCLRIEVLLGDMGVAIDN